MLQHGKERPRRWPQGHFVFAKLHRRGAPVQIALGRTFTDCRDFGL